MFPPLKLWGTSEGDAVREKKAPDYFRNRGLRSGARALNAHQPVSGSGRLW